MMTFSFNPRNQSTLPSIAAFVNTLVVSWKLAEDIKLSVNNEVFVIPVIKDNEGILTGKLFEYIGSGKKILCLGPKHGDAAKIIENAKAGITCNYNDTEDIHNFINKIYKTRENNNSDRKEIYSRAALTKELSTYL